MCEDVGDPAGFYCMEACQTLAGVKSGEQRDREMKGNTSEG